MSDIKRKLLEYQTIEIDQEIKELDIQKLMNVVDNTDFITNHSFIKNIIIQLPYIDKRSLILQLVLLVMGIWIIIKNKGNYESLNTTINIVSFIGGFLAGVDLIETCKSHQYDMWEIEAACKNNLREVMVQRYLITGLVSIIIICILSLVTSLQLQIDFLNILLYFMIPFMLVCASYLKAMRLIKHKVNDAILLGIVLFINSIFIIVVLQIKNYIFMNLWLIASTFIIILLIYIKEVLQFINESKEEIEWN